MIGALANQHFIVVFDGKNFNIEKRCNNENIELSTMSLSGNDMKIVTPAIVIYELMNNKARNFN